MMTSDVKLLVYEIVMDKNRGFVTAFPIDQKFSDFLMGLKPSSDVAFKPRFNLYIDPTWTVVKHESKGFLLSR